MPPLFSLHNIVFRHHPKAPPTLNGVSLELFPGDRIGLVGPNGSGKSTLLHIGAGLLQPESGWVEYNGTVCTTESEFINARKHLGYMLQRAEDQLFSSTILEDVAFGPCNLGYSPEEAERMAWDTLRALSIEHLAHCNGQRISGGEQAMAALASILVMKVDFLFLDEPTSSLDIKTGKLLAEILDLYGLPLIIASHDTDFLQKSCNKLFSLDN